MTFDDLLISYYHIDIESLYRVTRALVFAFAVFTVWWEARCLLPLHPGGDTEVGGDM